MVFHPATSVPVQRAVLAEFVRRARRHRGQWIVGLAGVLLPGLPRSRADSTPNCSASAADFGATMLAGLLEQLDAPGVPSEEVAEGLLWTVVRSPTEPVVHAPVRPVWLSSGLPCKPVSDVERVGGAGGNEWEAGTSADARRAGRVPQRQSADHRHLEVLAEGPARCPGWGRPAVPRERRRSVARSQLRPGTAAAYSTGRTPGPLRSRSRADLTTSNTPSPGAGRTGRPHRGQVPHRRHRRGHALPTSVGLRDAGRVRLGVRGASHSSNARCARFRLLLPPARPGGLRRPRGVQRLCAAAIGRHGSSRGCVGSSVLSFRPGLWVRVCRTGRRCGRRLPSLVAGR